MSFPVHFPVDTQGCISRDLPCIRCGYVLRTLTPGANCPECGTPVIKSLDIQRIFLAPRAWRKSLVTNLYVLAATPLAYFLLSAGCLSWASSSTGADRWSVILFAMINIGLLPAYVVALCRAMRLPPGVLDGNGRPPVERRGNWAMGCTIFGVLGSAGTIAAVMRSDSDAPGPAPVYALLTCVGLLALGIGLAMSRLASHARTIPRRRLAGSMELTGWTISVSGILTSVIVGLFLRAVTNVAIVPQQVTKAGTTLSIAVQLLSCMSLVAIVAAMIALFMLARAVSAIR